MIWIRTVATILCTILVAAPLAALTPASPPAPLAGQVIERFIACYPRVDAVRSRYRDEVVRLKQLHKAELDRLDGEFSRQYSPGMLGHLDAYWAFERRKNALTVRPARDLIFLPVVQECGFEDVEAYAEALHSIIYHFAESPDWLRPYLDRVAPMRVPNLE